MSACRGLDSVGQMANQQTVRFYLEPPLRESAVAGAHNFIGLMAKVCAAAGLAPQYCDIADAGLANGGYALTHMKPPESPNGLVFRRVYQYPFWQIDQTAARWDWDTAQAKFDPSQIDLAEAARFFAFWQERLYGAAPKATKQAGYIYVPLQGRLSEHRSFQTCSPLQMLEHCIAHEPLRQVIATLHPNEHYSAAEFAALERLERQHARLTVTVGDMVQHLQNCDYVVTQNSSAAFAGFFFQKPALLFAKIDFHHIAVRADMADLAESFAQVTRNTPDYGQYIWWFWQDQSINAGRVDAEAKIAARLRRFGWPI